MSASPAPTIDYAPAPPGWYADPAHAGARRYWDGKSWTQETAPAAEPPKPSVSSALAAAGYVSALFVPILGLILGLVATKKHNGIGTNHGAWIIVVALASFLVGLLILSAGSA
jgi:uncharacterized membrane protein